MNWFFKKSITPPKELDKYYDSFKSESATIVVFDTETTGLDPKLDEMVSIGALKLVEGKVIPKLTFYEELLVEVNGAVEVHEIVGDKSLSSERAVLLDFLDFIGNATLIGHHVSFDLKMINKAMEKHFGCTLKNQSKDTFQIALKKDHAGRIPDFYRGDRYSLDALCQRYSIDIKDRHHALGDAYLTAHLYVSLQHS